MKNFEKKICQNCKNQFFVEPEDFKFYEKMQVPAPTFCPDCRLQRRLAWRNERTLYQRKCDLCGKDIIAMYHKKVPFPVYCNECWWSDKWNPLSYGRAYDFSKPFFIQFGELMQRVPRFPFFKERCKNCDYVNVARDSKNCYLVFGCVENEDSAYGKIVWNCKNVFDGLYCYKCEQCYEVIDCVRCYNLVYSKNCVDCRDSAFLEDCSNCTNCFGCVGLKNKRYCFENVELTKEEYEKRVKGMWKHICGYSLEDISLRYPKRFANFLASPDCTGDHLLESTRCFHSFDLKYCEDTKFCSTAQKLRESYDCIYSANNNELSYEVVTSLAYNMRFSVHNFNCMNVSYSFDCYSSENLFGCTGLSKAKYCILNRQYTKESFDELMPKIIQHMKDMSYMDKKRRVYRYGEFFPIELSPFAYNETVAQEHFPLSAEAAVKAGYRWKDNEVYQRATTLTHDRLPDHVKDVPDSITNEIIQCAHSLIYGGSTFTDCNEQCTTAFRIIPQELAFYRKMQIPLPRLCPNCRHYQRLKKRNPFKLWHRACTCQGRSSANGIYQNTIVHFHKSSPCPNGFETTYSPERQEIIYCEQCYLAEVA